MTGKWYAKRTQPELGPTRRNPAVCQHITASPQPLSDTTRCVSDADQRGVQDIGSSGLPWGMTGRSAAPVKATAVQAKRRLEGWRFSLAAPHRESILNPHHSLNGPTSSCSGKQVKGGGRLRGESFTGYPHRRVANDSIASPIRPAASPAPYAFRSQIPRAGDV